MDDLIRQIQDRQFKTRQERRRREGDEARSQVVVAACRTVAGWKAGSIVRAGWLPENEEDVVLQLAWAIHDLAAAIGRCGLADRVQQLAAEDSDPARQYALNLILLAGREGTREELELRVQEVWRHPSVWREVAASLATLPEMLWRPRASQPGAARDICHRVKQTGRLERDRVARVGPSREQVPDEAVGPGVAAGPGAVSIQTQVLPLKEAAEILGVSLRKAYKMHRAGELRGPAGKPYRAYRRSVEELLETPRTMPDAAPSEPAPSNQAGRGQEAATQERRQPCRRERSPQGYQFFELP